MSNAAERTEKARALLASRRFGALSTNSKRVDGVPFGSVVNFAVDSAGLPLFLFSSLAVHRKNLEEDPRASFLVFSPEAETDAVTAARLTLLGQVVDVPEEDVDAAKAAYLAKHPAASEYVDFGDFAFYRLEVIDAYFVGGFGEMGWIQDW